MNLLRFSRPAGYNYFLDNGFNSLFRDLENENCFVTPSANVIETKEDFKIELSVAGFTKEQITIQFQDNLLIVKGKSEDQPNENEKFLTREFGFKRIVRRFSLPKTVDPELISASSSNGVLTIVIPKKTEDKEKELKEIVIN